MPNTASSASQKKKRISSILIAFSVFAVLLADQISKLVILHKLSQDQSIPIIKGILHITFVKNTGAAFGLFKNSTFIFIGVSIAAIIMILAMLIKSIRKNRFLSSYTLNSGLVLIMSGAMGNLIDRVRLGYVVDFIDVRVWPVFNIADSTITIGTLLLIVSFSKFDKK